VGYWLNGLPLHDPGKMLSSLDNVKEENVSSNNFELKTMHTTLACE